MDRRGFKSRIYKIVGLVVFFYLSYQVVKIGYQSWQFNKVVKNLEEEIGVLEDENTNLKNKILYYQTQSYKERVMRENLDYKKPGEEVLVIIPEKKPEPKKEETRQKLSNQRKWWIFFFGNKEQERSI